MTRLEVALLIWLILLSNMLLVAMITLAKNGDLELNMFWLMLIPLSVIFFYIIKFFYSKRIKMD